MRLKHEHSEIDNTPLSVENAKKLSVIPDSMVLIPNLRERGIIKKEKILRSKNEQIFADQNDIDFLKE